MSGFPEDPKVDDTGFERDLADSSIEYLLFIIDQDSDTRKTVSQLETLRRAAVDLCQDLTKNYIWQRDEFHLELKNEGGALPMQIFSFVKNIVAY